MREFWLEQAEANRWINRTWLDAIAVLPFEEWERERGAFFGSIFGTWNHLLLGDRVWLGRIRGEPYPVQSLSERQAETLAAFRTERERTDAALIELIAGWADFGAAVAYASRGGQACSWPMRTVLAHLTAHQHHHRGQISQMCHAAGVELPDGALSPYLRSTGRPM